VPDYVGPNEPNNSDIFLVGWVDTCPSHLLHGHGPTMDFVARGGEGYRR